MNHDAISRRLSAYMDGEVSAEERIAIEFHLGECSACAMALRDLRAVSQAVRGLPAVKLDAALLKRLHATVDQAGRRPVERFVGLLSGIAACLAVMGGLLLLRPAAASTLSPPARWEGRAAGLIDDTSLSSANGNRESALGDWMTSDLSANGAAKGAEKGATP